MTGGSGASLAPTGGAVIDGQNLVLSFGETPALRGRISP